MPDWQVKEILTTGGLRRNVAQQEDIAHRERQQVAPWFVHSVCTKESVSKGVCDNGVPRKSICCT